MTVWETAVGATVDWYTPPTLFERIGLEFDLDPAAPALPSADWIPAAFRVTEDTDGLSVPWFGRVWLNPPYGRLTPAFMSRMTMHADGLALVASRTETDWFQQSARRAHAVCFLRDRLHFIRADGFQARSSHASVLMAWGPENVAALERADLGFLVKGEGRR